MKTPVWTCLLALCLTVTVTAGRHVDGTSKVVLNTFPRRSSQDVVARARHHAIQVIVEKMFRALGQDFPENPNITLPVSDVLPTVSTVNITTDPCPDIYSKCSSESFLPSCAAPTGSNAKLWWKMYNLYFALPEDLLKSDTLLNATLQLYKNKTLPLDQPTMLNVELYAYTKNATRRREYITSTNVTSDYIGWVSLDVTDLISNLNIKNNHGFHIKVKEFTGIYWNDLHTFVAMDCSNKHQKFIALPFGVQTDQPESKFPSLNIRTGSPDGQEMFLDQTAYYYDDSSDAYPKEESNLAVPDDAQMFRDDPNVIDIPERIVSDTPHEIHLAPKRVNSPLFSDFKTDFASIESDRSAFAWWGPNSWSNYRQARPKRHQTGQAHTRNVFHPQHL